jgi:hypothetical protein
MLHTKIRPTMEINEKSAGITQIENGFEKCRLDTLSQIFSFGHATGTSAYFGSFSFASKASFSSD